MSSGSGAIFPLTGGRPMGYFIYNGTADVVLPSVRYSVDEAWEMDETWPGECQCDLLEEVYLYTNYGGGFHWKGYWCPGCRRVALEKGVPYAYNKEDRVEIVDGLPENCEWP